MFFFLSSGAAHLKLKNDMHLTDELHLSLTKACDVIFITNSLYFFYKLIYLN